METLEPEETLNPRGSDALENSQAQIVGAMPQELGLGLNVEAPTAGESVGGGFEAGEFVWGKIWGQPWWPGRVCDPSEGPHKAKKAPRREQSSVLVSYFGGVSLAWCNGSKLKPFVECFDEFATSSSLKNFRAAVDSALSEVGKCLEAQLSCNCLHEEEKSKFGKYLSKSRKISNFEVDEFVGLVNDVAADVNVVNAVGIMKLKSWAAAFERGVSSGHKRKAVSELVDKIDLDVPAAEVSEGPEVSKGLEILSQKSNEGRRRRSMVTLIAQLDLDSVEVSDDDDDYEEEQQDKKKSRKDLKAEDGDTSGNVKDEEVGSGRRERKKSKYLSPPYTYLSGGLAKSLVSPKSSEVRTPKSPRGFFSGSTVVKCSTEGLGAAEEDESGAFLQLDGLEVREMLSEYLATAANSLHWKLNRSAKMVRNFLVEFRSSVYSSGIKYATYQKLITESVGTDGKIVNKEVSDESEEGKVTAPVGKSDEDKKIEGKRRRTRKDMGNGNGENLVDKSEEGKKTGSKRGRKRKDIVDSEGEIPVNLSHQTAEASENMLQAASSTDALKEGINGMTPVHLMRQTVIVSHEGTSERRTGRKRKAHANQNVTAKLGSKSVNHLELGTEVQEQIKKKRVANGKATAELNIEGDNKNGPIVDVHVNMGGHTIGSGAGKSRQTTNSKNSATHEEPAAIMLTFTPGSSLPSKDDLVSAFSKYGPVIQSETELLPESSSAKVVFGRSSDAEKAFNDKIAAVGLAVVNYRLRYLTGNFGTTHSPATPIPVPKPPLSYVRQSLERMISTLSGSPLDKIAGTSEGLKPETRDNLVGEMQGLLMKVDKMITGPASGTSN